MIDLDAGSGAADTAGEVVELFSAGGRTYTVPARPRVNVALKYMRAIRKIGPTLAEAQLLEDLLGEDGYDALCDCDLLTAEQLSQIAELASKHALGALEEAPEGNDAGGSERSAG